MITKGKVAILAYILKNANGDLLDKGDKQDPFAYLHGMNQIVPGLERALEGLNKGDKKSVELEPKDAYGEYNASLLLQVKRAQFPGNVALQVGMQFESGTQESGFRVFTVEKIVGDVVTINGNHPLAGEKLFFDIEVLDVRDATEEELAHGHVHGPNGHHHH